MCGIDPDGVVFALVPSSFLPSSVGVDVSVLAVDSTALGSGASSLIPRALASNV